MIVIAGGAGFIGSNLCQYYLDQGKDVIVLDNLSTGTQIVPGVKFYKIDITDPDLGDLFRSPIEAVINLACPASPPAYQRDPIGTMLTCVVGTKNLLDLAKEHGAVFLQASTSEVYGDPEVSEQNEEYRGNVNPDGPRSCYDEGKRAAEALCFDYYRLWRTRIKVIRIFNTYGPGMDKNDGRVLPNFINQALEGKDITIYGDGTQTRSLMYITDLLRGIDLMIGSADSITGPVNLGRPEEITMNELANLVIELTGSDSKVVHQELPTDDPRKRKPVIQKAKEYLSWEPKVDMRTGISNLIDYLKMKESLITFSSRLHGYHVRLKELHFSAPTLSIHKVIDDFDHELLEFDDSVMEDSQSMVGLIQPGDLKVILPKSTEINDLLAELKGDVLDYYDSLEGASMWIGVRSEIEGFIHTICKTIYLIKIGNGN